MTAFERLQEDTIQNNLLRALKMDDWVKLSPLLREWQAEPGAVLHRPGDEVQFAYFPRGASLISYLVVLQDGRAIETAMVGREGAIGGFVSQGRLPAYTRAEVQCGGDFFRVGLREPEEIKSNSPSVRSLFARYADCLLSQIFQSVACNATHSIEQRTAKWLLAAVERTGDTDILLTQEQMAAMLGVGRSYLSRVIAQLKEKGVIEARRSRICVSDPQRLEAAACECTRSVSRHFDEVLRGVYPHGDDH